MKLDQAIIEAYKAHEGQLDKAGEPYIKHPLRVMRRVLTRHDQCACQHCTGFNENVAVVAVLHDVWEDTDYVLRHLNTAQQVALAAVTRHWAENEHETYKEYIARCSQNLIARVVKYHDLLDNLSPERMSYLSHGEQKGMRERYNWSLEFLQESQA